MKTIVQNYRDGKLQLIDIKVPACNENEIIIQTRSSVVSVGTEKSISTLAKKNLFQKAKARPDLVKRVIEKVQTEGISKTYKDVLGRLEKLTPLGYSACGTVIRVGENVEEIKPGDFVAVIGADIASHSSIIVAPEMMCLKLNSEIGDSAAFGMLGIIAMHGVRCSAQQPGSVIGVIGLGLLGILTAQILVAYGFQIVGFDPDVEKIEMCKSFGFDNVFSDRQAYTKCLHNLSNGAGGDATIIAAATQSNVPIEDAIESTRNGGKIVVTGVVDIHPDRNELWHKEIELIVSRAGGPGGLDKLYEQEGIDLPIQYARWSQKRNLKEFFRLVQEGKIDPSSLISSYTYVDDAISLYDSIIKGTYHGLAPVIYYSKSDQNKLEKNDTKKISEDLLKFSKHSQPLAYKGEIKVDMIGAGQFARSALLPNLSRNKNVHLYRLATRTQSSSVSAKNKFRFHSNVSDPEKLFANVPDTNALVIATRHSLHYSYIEKAVRAGYRYVLVEKPMVTNRSELEGLRSLKEDFDFSIMVGYNRRYSPHTQRVKSFFASGRITNVTYVVNAGFVPRDHWVFEKKEGRSRIVGEMCHFFDFFQYITGARIESVTVVPINGADDREIVKDNMTVVCKMDNGAVCNLSYYANGDRGLSRENIYIFGSGYSAHIDNFSKTRLFGNGKSSTKKTLGQDIGYFEETKEFVDLMHGKTEEQSFDDLCKVMEVCFAVEDILAGNSI
ncbi:zinc-binding dehydrogenase [Rhodobacteraceae bacterium IMCC1335]